MNDIIWNHKYIITERKARIYKSALTQILVLIYGAETRPDTVKTRAQMQVTEVKVLRRILRKIRWDRIRNTNIRETGMIICRQRQCTTIDYQKSQEKTNYYAKEEQEDREKDRVKVYRLGKLVTNRSKSYKKNNKNFEKYYS